VLVLEIPALDWCRRPRNFVWRRYVRRCSLSKFLGFTGLWTCAAITINNKSTPHWIAL
jgi:hypothetical protein